MTSNSTPAPPGPWTGTRLLVPMTVEALPVSNLDREGGDTEWSMGVPDYRTLPSGIDPDPGPFNQSPRLLKDQAPTLPDTGVMLHWALPDALTHGTQADMRGDGGDAIQFPLVPNRWFVLRMYTDPQDALRRLTRAWLVQSDYGPDGTTLFPNPDPATREAQPTVYIGKVWPLDDWQGETEALPLFLRAIGPSDATFAAFQPNVQDVFGLHDDLQDLPAGYHGMLTYLVAGWYSDPAQDLLVGASRSDSSAWADVAGTFNWSVGSEDDLEARLQAAAEAAQAWLRAHNPAGSADAPYPAQLLCHGMVYSVPWFGPEGPPEDDPDGRWRVRQYTAPSALQPQIALGNTGTEALAALLTHNLLSSDQNPYDIIQHTPQLETILKAFQYGLLPKLDGPDGRDEVARGIHAAAFGHRPGGSRWTVVQKPSMAPPPPPPSPSQPVPPPVEAAPLLTTGQAQLLQGLNLAQGTLDALQRVLASRRQELYALWWKQLKSANDLFPVPGEQGPDYAALLAQLAQQIQDLTAPHGPIQTAQANRDQARADLTAALGDALTLLEEALPSFWRASDPVVLVAGARRSFKHGADGRFADDGRLFCRFSGQTITSLAVRATADANAPAATVDAPRLAGLFGGLSGPASAHLPPEIQDLCLEAYLLDTANAPALAALTGQQLGVSPTDPTFVKNIAAQQTLAWNADVDADLDRQTVAAAAGLDGVVPSLVGVACWRPPWSPLFLDWKLLWFPSDPDPSAARQRWTLGDVDYQLTAGGATASPDEYQGRTLLTPGATRALQQQLDDFIRNAAGLMVEIDEENKAAGGGGAEEYGDDFATQLKAVADSLESWDVLSQSLSGLTEKLVQRAVGWVPAPDAGVQGRLGDADVVPPDLSVSSFHPLRAGRFRIEDLRIVDAFGQVARPLENYQGRFPWIRDGSLIPSDPSLDDPQLMQLPPRLSQHSRLLCRLVSADDDTQDTGVYPGTTPICGWLLPNYLDGGLSIFDAGGRNLGELFTARSGGGTSVQSVQWEVAPGASADGASRDVPNEQDIPNRHLRRFVAGLLTPGLDSGNALVELLAAIDLASWAINPPGGPDGSGNLAALIGRPIAVVRAQLQLELDGDPVYDQGWANTESIVRAALTGDAATVRTLTRGFVDTPFTVRLGAAKNPGDGLLGYCADDEIEADAYRRFHAVHAPPAMSGVQYLDAGTEMALSCDPAGKLVTMLLDPRGGVTLTCGILPAQRLTVPFDHMQGALAAMEVTFRVGPLVSETETLRLPLPAKVRGEWSWVAHAGTNGWTDVSDIATADGQARLRDDPARLIEGWLKLRGSLTSGPGQGR